MSDFLERNKKRGILGMWLRGRRVLVALLCLTAVSLALVFVSRSNLLTGSAGAAGSLSRLRASFSAVKRDQGLSWATIFGRGPAAAGPSSVEFVRGDAAELGLVASPGAAAKSVRGILTPEDARRAGRGVALSDEDLEGQRAASADLGQPTAYAGRGFFAGSQGAEGRAGEDLRGALDGSDVPAAGAGGVRGVSPGRLPKAKGKALSVEMRASMDRSLLDSRAKSVTDLVQARDRASGSRAPDCTAATGCTTEFAAANLGAVYDGNQVKAASPSSLSTPQVDGTSQLSPAEARGAGAPDEADQVLKDLQTCRRADADYSAREKELSLALQARIEQFRALGCPPSWGSRESRRRCDEKAAEVTASCRLYNAAQCAHIEACPLTASEGCTLTDCDSLLPPAPSRSFFTGLF
ncbi:MAG: hypothetical protein NTY77_09370 [Elusimicrobia bacterium]|nr:hypothetical protein [Elusimicrobiota bacterium]